VSEPEESNCAGKRGSAQPVTLVDSSFYVTVKVRELFSDTYGSDTECEVRDNQRDRWTQKLYLFY
jgi:hypothetical protein